MANFQLLILSPKVFKFERSFLGVGGGGWVTNFQFLILSPKNAKVQMSHFLRRGVGGQLPTFDAECKKC